MNVNYSENEGAIFPQNRHLNMIEAFGDTCGHNGVHCTILVHVNRW